MFPPPNISVQTPEEVREHAKSLVDTVILQLTRTAASADAEGAKADPRAIVFKGDLDSINEHFHEQRWTEGLPIVPPTRAAVEAMLKFTDRSPDEVIGVLRPGRREVTVWKTAVNGVMAGCRPEYMPILLAIMEAETDPNSGIEGFNSTSGQFPVIILNGPIIKELNINHGQGMVRGRRQANISISRFLSLCMITIARLRLGETDMTTFDRNYYPAVAEAEDDSPWEPLSETLGFAPGSNVVTVQGAAMMGYSFLTEGDAESHLHIIAQEVARDIGNSHYLIHPMLGPVTSHSIYLGPQVANIIAKAGYSKRDVKQYIFDHARVPAHQLEEFMKRHALLPDIDPEDITFCEMVRQGRLPPHFCESKDPNRMVPVVQHPDEFLLVVTGFPTRNRSRILRQGGQHGRRVSREIKLPTKWRELLAQASTGAKG